MSGLHVLLGSDDILSQWITAEILAGSGFLVTSACRGKEVVKLLQADADFDVFLADATLFDTSPMADLMSLWRRTAIGRPLIYSGARSWGVRYPLQRTEFFLEAPYTASSLLRTIDQAIEEAAGGRFLPTIAATASHVH